MSNVSLRVRSLWDRQAEALIESTDGGPLRNTRVNQREGSPSAGVSLDGQQAGRGVVSQAAGWSSTWRIASARSRRPRGFMRKARIPIAFAFSSVIVWLKPVQRMMGMSGRMRSSSFATTSPVRWGIVWSVMMMSKDRGLARKTWSASCPFVC